MKNLRKNPKLPSAKTPQEKVFGRPTQDLYSSLLRQAKSPKQSELVQELCHTLKDKGIPYHPRTIKRQLLGKIEYIPEALEQAVLDWVRRQKAPGYQKLLQEFQKNKGSLESSEDQNLYVATRPFLKMAQGYLALHKGLSRRRLALLLQENLRKQNIQIGLETLQAAVAGKTRKIRKILEKEMRSLFHKEGFKEDAQLNQFLEETLPKEGRGIQKVEVGNIAQVVDAFLIKTENLSKRQLALRILERLKEKGYVYHLSSIQSVLEGKTQKTKQAILDTIYELLKQDGLGAPAKIQDYLNSIPEAQRHWHRYIPAEKIPPLVENLLQAHRDLTRRQLALILKEELARKNFIFSLNTLQYILAGKTKRTRGVVADLLESFSKKADFQELLVQRQNSPGGKKGRPSLDARMAQLAEKIKNVSGAERELLHESFLKTREELIKKRWTAKHPQRFGRRKTWYSNPPRDSIYKLDSFSY